MVKLLSSPRDCTDRELAEAVGISATSVSAHNSSKEYLLFLMKLLRETSNSRGNPEVVYPLLRANQDKLNDKFIAVVQAWAKATFPNLEASLAEGIAGLMSNFGTFINEFPLGNKAANIEISLGTDETILTLLTRHSHPELWAMTQNNLGLTYSNRIKGDRAENMETAIAAYQNALLVYTKEAFPIDWADTQYNLGNAYQLRIKGEPFTKIVEKQNSCSERFTYSTTSSIQGINGKAFISWLFQHLRLLFL